MAVNNQTCNKTLFLASHSLANVYSKANESISKTNAYIKSIKNTLLDMDLTLNNIANLKLSLITDFVSNAASLDLIISQFTYSSVTLYLYPEDSNPNQDLLIYAKMIDNVKKISYFKAKYPFLTNQMYLKVSGMLGSKNDLQAIMPNFIGEPFIRTDDSSISLSLELSGEGIVYAIAIQAGKAEPISGDQIARGVDGSGNEANKDVKKILLDSEGNLRPVIIKFNSLENDVLYNIFYTVGIQVPRESLISSKIEKIVSMARNPKRGNKNKRILNADEEENEQKFR